jgi:ATP-dependent Zn protease
VNRDDPPPAEPSPAFDLVTAYHEAGHAVVALALDRPVHRVSVLPNQEHLGKCEFRKGVQRGSVDFIEQEILISLAGMAAEARLTGRYDRGGAGRDLRYVRTLALQRASEKQLDRYERRMLAKVENLMSDEALWAAVESIAKELMKRGQISGRAAVHLFKLATKDG